MYTRHCRNPLCGNLIIDGGSKVYCSQKCRQAVYRGKQKTQSRKPSRIVICKKCGDKFVTSQPNAQFHSTSCRVSFWQQQKRLERKYGED